MPVELTPDELATAAQACPAMAYQGDAATIKALQVSKTGRRLAAV
jgi:hypothetical protein